MTQTISEAWRSTLRGIPDQKKFVADAHVQAREHHLVYDGQLMMQVAEPVWMTDQQRAEDQRRVAAVMRSLVAAIDYVRQHDELRNELFPAWNNPEVVDLFDIDAGYRQPFVFGRFDGAMTSDGLQIMEFNGGLPGGIVPASQSAAIMQSWPAYAEVEAEYDIKPFDLLDDVVTTLIDTWHDFGGVDLPTIALVVPSELHPYVQGTFQVVGDAARERGVTIVLVEPSDLVFDEHLSTAGQQIDLVVRGFFTPMLFTEPQRFTALMQAVKARAVCMVTSIESGLYGNKGLFALMTDPDVALDVSEDIRAVTRATLPWTRFVTQGSTTNPDGQRTDLPAYVRAYQSDLVMKPVLGYGGADVILGWDVDEHTWSSTLEAALSSGGHIVQKRIDIPQPEWMMLDEGFPTERFITDHNPIVCNGRIAGYYTRVSAAGLTSVTSGTSSVVPSFLYREKKGHH